MWCRGIITNVFKLSLVEVLFVDFGDKVVIDTKFFISSPYLEFEQVPIQVLRCKLENIVPKGDKYPKNFIHKIQGEFIGKKVQIRFTRKNVKSFPLPVILHILDDPEAEQQPQNSLLKSFLPLLQIVPFFIVNFDSIFELAAILLRAKFESQESGLNLARFFVKEEMVKIMETRDEWYPKEVVQRQNEMAFFIQPSNSNRTIFTAEILEKISEYYPDFQPLPLPLDMIIPVTPIGQVQPLAFYTLELAARWLSKFVLTMG